MVKPEQKIIIPVWLLAIVATALLAGFGDLWRRVRTVEIAVVEISTVLRMTQDVEDSRILSGFPGDSASLANRTDEKNCQEFLEKGFDTGYQTIYNPQKSLEFNGVKSFDAIEF